MNEPQENREPTAEENAPAEEIKEETVPEAETADAPESPAEEKDPAAEEIAGLTAALAAEKDKYLRLAAEYDNFRKRSARERDNIYADVKADTITKLLPVYDNLLRALRNPTADEAYKKGVAMTMNQFIDTLKAMGVTPIEAEGQTFDPTLHNAVMHMEDPEKGEQEIVAEFQKGFRCGDKVIRFSMVQVAN